MFSFYVASEVPVLPLTQSVRLIQSIRPIFCCPLFLSVSSLRSGAWTELQDQSADGHRGSRLERERRRPSLLLGCRSAIGTCEDHALHCKTCLLPVAGIRRSDQLSGLRRCRAIRGAPLLSPRRPAHLTSMLSSPASSDCLRGPHRR